MAEHPKDEELQDYLTGEHEVSRLYREGGGEQPPPELDAAILDYARRKAEVTRPAWVVPTAVAATVLLGLGVVFELQDGTLPTAEEAMLERNGAEQAPAAAPMPGRALKSEPRSLEDRAAPAQAGDEAARLDATGRAEAPSETDMEAAVEPPDAWLARIEELQAAGETEQARQALSRFREQYPDYPLPQTLKKLEADDAGDH